jgi:Flp pilus assembly protein protease CpaA
MDPVNTLVALALVGMALVVELLTNRIPNWLTVPGMLAGMGLGIYSGDLTAHALGLIALAVIGIGLFAARWILGGTAKLLMAVGSLAGLGGGLSAALAVALVYLLVLCWIRVSSPGDEDLDQPEREPWVSFPTSPMVFIGLLSWWFSQKSPGTWW